MIPVSYKMIDLAGLDLADINFGMEVPGIYNKIQGAYNTSRFAILCNWFFAKILLPPAHVLVLQPEANVFTINDTIVVTSDDKIYLPGTITPVVLEELFAYEDGIYIPPSGVDGFSKVTVDVPEPVLVQLTATNNGTFTPATGQDGFSQVSVNVQPTLTALSVTENGTYTPGQGIDGFSSVEVNVSGGIPGLEKIEAAYNGAVYGFLSGYQFYTDPNNNYGFAFFDVTPGHYICQINPSGAQNRFRYMHYASHSFEDIESIVLTPNGGNFSGTSPYGNKDTFLEDPIHIEIFSSGCFMVYYYSGYYPIPITEVLLLKENFT